MSRTQIKLNSNDNQESSRITEEILNAHKFERVTKNGEEYWQQGIGVTQSPKFIKYYFEGDQIILEGWVKNFGKESDLSGVVGAVPKRSCKKIFNEIKDAIIAENKNPPTPKKENTQKTTTTNTKTLTEEAFDFINEKSTPTTTTQKTTSHETTTHTVQNKSSSNGIIPRKYRGNTIQNIIEIIIAIIYIIGAMNGILVLRFTDSSEALMLVAIMILIHGTLSLISNLMDNS